MSDLDTADKFAMYVGGSLLILGTVGIGIIEMVGGSPHPVSGEGQIVHEALVPIEFRSDIILAGLLVLGLYSVYKLVGGDQPSGTAQHGIGTQQTK